MDGTSIPSWPAPRPWEVRFGRRRYEHARRLAAGVDDGIRCPFSGRGALNGAHGQYRVMAGGSMIQDVVARKAREGRDAGGAVGQSVWIASVASAVPPTHRVGSVGTTAACGRCAPW